MQNARLTARTAVDRSDWSRGLEQYGDPAHVRTFLGYLKTHSTRSTIRGDHAAEVSPVANPIFYLLTYMRESDRPGWLDYQLAGLTA